MNDADTAVGSITRAQFAADIGTALSQGRGYAAGKLGNAERMFLSYPRVLERYDDPLRIRTYELALANHALRHAGIFPHEPAFLRRFSEAYAGAVARLDCMGLQPELPEADRELLRAHGFRGNAIRYHDQEPDRSSPADESRCYLPLLRDRRLLLVCPFADLLRERATQETFEAVWRKTGKPWFAPARVEAIELPYGYSPATWRRFPDALALLDDVVGRIDGVEYDAALIAAGGLGSLIATALKERGKVAISLGGHLQIVFGILGERWRDRRRWAREYFNDAWIDLPDRYRPGKGESAENYW